MKVEFAEYKTQQETAFKTEIDSLKELIRDLRGDVGEIMSMHDGQEEDLNSRLDRHRFDINQLREDHNSLREEYQELEAEAAVLRICISHMQDQLCHCSDHHNPPISTVGSPDLPAVPASPKYSLEFHTPSIEVHSLGTVFLAPSTPEPIPIPPPVASPLPSSDAENIPPTCCSNPPPPHAPLVPIKEVMSNAEDLDSMAERAEQALDKEIALSFLNQNNQGRGARRQAVCSLSRCTHPYTHRMQPGDHHPRRRGGIFDGLNQQQACCNRRSEQGLRGYESSSEVHPMGVTKTSFLMDFQMDGILRGLQMLLPRRPLSLWSLQGTVIANELGQYRLEVLLTLTQEEGNQMLSKLASRDRAESPEVFWDGSTDIGPEYDDNAEV